MTAQPALTGTNIRRRRIAECLLGAATLYFVLCRFVPWTPPLRKGYIEESYFEVLQIAFREHWQFGRDIVFTYGPWGFLYGGTEPATHWISVFIWLTLSIIFWWAAVRAMRGCFRESAMGWIWLFLFVAAAGAVHYFTNMDARFAGWTQLFLIVHFFSEDRPLTLTQACLAASLGLLSLIKFSVFIQAGVTVGIVAANVMLRHRRFPWVMAIYCGSILFFWRMAKQSWDGLPLFIENSLRLAGGYTEAMGLAPVGDTRDLCVFLGGAFVTLALVAYACWRRYRLVGILPLAGMAFAVFTAFKYGYVRHDAHEVMGAVQLLLAGLAALAAAQTIPWKKAITKRVAMAVPVAYAGCLILALMGRYSPDSPAAAFGETFGLNGWLGPLAITHGNEPFVRAQAKYYSSVRQRFPIPQVSWTVDVYPWNQVAVFAEGLQYRPRPVIQSYSAYTPELAELNAGFLLSEHAPDNVLFTIATIDGHVPAQEDGPSWPELLSRYDLASTNDSGLLLFRHSPNPRHFQKISIGDTVIPFQSNAKLPSAHEGPLWIEIEINKSMIGRLVTALYKPPEIGIAITLSDGRTGHLRLVPGMARAGFLISPFIEDTKSFVRLAQHDKPNEPAGPEVTSLSVFVVGGTGHGACYADPIKIRLYRLKFDPINLPSESAPSNSSQARETP